MAKFKSALVVAGVAGMSLMFGDLRAAGKIPVNDTEKVILERIAEIEKDPAKRKIAYDAGRERIMLCAHCHGEDGNSLRPEIPNLAGQNPTYLIEQVDKFADGRRKNFVMQTLASNFTAEDKVNLAVYFNSQLVKPEKADPMIAIKAEHIYKTICQLCHGETGKGAEGYARIAGQRPQYVVNTLRRFRAAAQQTIDAADIKRTSTRMEQVTQRLTDEEIEALANYIALLP